MVLEMIASGGDGEDHPGIPVLASQLMDERDDLLLGEEISEERDAVDALDDNIIAAGDMLLIATEGLRVHGVSASVPDMPYPIDHFRI